MFTFNKNKIKIDRTNVKYIAYIENLDKKFFFARSFINGFSMDMRKNHFILEVSDANKNKKYFKIDSKKETATEVTYEILNKEVKDDRELFCFTYF